MRYASDKSVMNRCARYCASLCVYIYIGGVVYNSAGILHARSCDPITTPLSVYFGSFREFVWSFFFSTFFFKKPLRSEKMLSCQFFFFFANKEARTRHKSINSSIPFKKIASIDIKIQSALFDMIKQRIGLSTRISNNSDIRMDFHRSDEVVNLLTEPFAIQFLLHGDKV